MPGKYDKRHTTRLFYVSHHIKVTALPLFYSLNRFQAPDMKVVYSMLMII